MKKFRVEKSFIFIIIIAIILGCSFGSYDIYYTGGSGINFGGVGDWDYYKSQVESGQVPSADALDINGFFSAHTIALPDPDPNVPITMHAMFAFGLGCDREEPYPVLQLGFNSGVSITNYQTIPINLSLVIDKSGSMASENRIGYVKQGIKLMLDSLTENDILSIVVYDSSARVLRAAAPVTDINALKNLVNSIEADGSTALYDGMVMGYEEVKKNFSTNKVNRVILLSDGEANVGISDSPSIIAKSKTYNEEGIGLTTIGVGSGFNYELMSGLATEGGGNFYFVNSVDKITNVFKDELDFILTPFAKDLKITFNFSNNFEIDTLYGFALTTNESNRLELNIPTVYLSKRNGVMLAQLKPIENLRGMSSLKVLDIDMSYNFIQYSNSNCVQNLSEVFPGTNYYEDSPNLYYVKNNSVRKSLALLNVALTFKTCSTLVLLQDNKNEALTRIGNLYQNTTREATVLKDTELSNLLPIIDKLKQNINSYNQSPAYYY